jgi:hypothetical protein
MKLETFGEDPVEMTIPEFANFFWDWQDASRSPSREQRLRADRGDLRGAFGLVEAAFAQDDLFDELVAEIIRVRLASSPPSDFGTLSAGYLEDRWNSGDHEIFTRLRARGIDQVVLDQLESGIWKTDPVIPKPRAKPRWNSD